MTSPAALFGTLAAALAVAKLFGHLFDKLKLPPILGQILAGLVLVQLPHPVPELLHGEAFSAFSEIGLLFLLFITGTESSVADMRRAGLPSTLVAIGGVLGPFVAGYGAARYLGVTTPQALVTGALFTPTSIGITAVALMEAHRLRTTVGATLVGAAIIDDVLALALLAVVLGTGTIGGVLGKATVYLVAAGLLSWKVLPRLYHLVRGVHLAESPVGFVLVAVLAFSAAAEGFGLAAITGAFIIGLAVRETMGEEKLLDRMHAIAYGLFIPLFFVHLGASLELGTLGRVGAFAPLLLAASFGGKFLGSALGGLLGRLGPRRAVQVGVGMLPRMEVSLVVVAVATRQGIFTGTLAEVMTGIAILNMVVSLVVTPVLMRAAFRLEPEVAPHHPPIRPPPAV